MEKRVSPMACLLFIALLISAFHSSSEAADSRPFEDNFSIMWSEDHFKTSEDGNTWYLSLDKETGCGFQTKQRYRFGWFSMKLKLVGGDSAGVVTAYYMCSENGAGPERDELDFEFLGNRTGQPYLIQTNVYKNGVGNREMRHMLWFDPTEDYHSYSIYGTTTRLCFLWIEFPLECSKTMLMVKTTSSPMRNRCICFRAYGTRMSGRQEVALRKQTGKSAIRVVLQGLQRRGLPMGRPVPGLCIDHHRELVGSVPGLASV
ncbi:putative xyloglucan endotransglucosylase/hydrolase protein 8 [Hibiscus syriacus]|uniref:Xyloglucan endotransglucosylase/hydrolase protein 8 n=1 Tax=Hibiscus syriacus TaxID=106335 RepID=A0A6A2ZDX0_HIBSY|nr:putative xyloglucan endotransglucosylase/hydrolase protein 8 [Hibiscus syriacus]